MSRCKCGFPVMVNINDVSELVCTDCGLKVGER